MAKNLKEKDNSTKSLFLKFNKFSYNNGLKSWGGGRESSNESKHNLWKPSWIHLHKSKAIPGLLSGELRELLCDKQKANPNTVRS